MPYADPSFVQVTPDPAGEAFFLTWVYDSNLPANLVSSVYIHVNDNITSENRVGFATVSSASDGCGNLITSYHLLSSLITATGSNNVTVPYNLVNGITYSIALVVNLTDSTQLVTYTSAQCSTIPLIPDFQYPTNLFQISTNGFAVSLTNIAPSSLADGFSTLTALYVYYFDSSQNYGHKVFLNDSSNSLYTGTFEVPVTNGTYEVYIELANANGRSGFSQTDDITVGNIATQPQNLTVGELMYFDPSINYPSYTNIAASTYGNTVQTIIAWNDPTFNGSPTYSYFTITRTDASGSILLHQDTSTNLLRSNYTAFNINDCSYA